MAFVVTSTSLSKNDVILLSSFDKIMIQHLSSFRSSSKTSKFCFQQVDFLLPCPDEPVEMLGKTKIIKVNPDGVVEVNS